MNGIIQKHPSSYRDPAGFLFYHSGVLYRQINSCFKDDYELFINSGLYELLANEKLIIRHKENINLLPTDTGYKIIQPEKVPFISYPYEWCFDMWKDAALTTISAAKKALASGMMLRDAAAYNVQWHDGSMVIIDTLSFGISKPNEPWIAYRQFNEHFLSPLALMHFLKLPLQPLFMAYPNGIPLHIARQLLPFKSKLNLHTYLHLHLHARINTNNKNVSTANFSNKKLLHILDSLTAALHSYQFDQQTGVWSGYYKEAAERDDYLMRKKEIIEKWLNAGSYNTAVDLGANEGTFSLMAADKNIFTISTDADHFSVNKLYKYIKSKGIKNIQPVLLDLSNPSAAIGVNNEEWSSFLDRTHCDLVMALAVIHHLAIGSNIPFNKIADLFKKAGKWLIVEFVPKTDEKVMLMLKNKVDIYDWYTEEKFIETFSMDYLIEDKQFVGSTSRVLYLMKPKH